MKKTNLFLLFIVLVSSSLPAQYSLRGKVSGAEGESISNAKVQLSPGEYRAVTNVSGNYEISGIKNGKYTMTVTFIGYQDYTAVTDINGDVVVNVTLKPGGLTTEEIEINRAIDRETPVAFTDVDSKTLDSRMQGQDAPLLLRNVPGFYSYSTDGVGNGEGKLLIRGFSQNYVQVLINGIPTNDPESNSVYWSNWGSVSGNASSIQIQRGAGSSLYGSGSFGGSFNIITETPGYERFLGLKGNLGSPLNSMYGINIATGMLGKFSGAFNVERKIGEGSRTSGRYEGTNYYLAASFLPEANQSLKFVLHGAPQEHGYSFSGNIAYFKKFGYKANPAPFLTRDVANAWDSKYSSNANYKSITDGSRELVDDNFVNLSHNFYHKPQAEIHWNYSFKDNSLLHATLFYTMGRGAGSSLNSTGTVFDIRKGLGVNGVSIDTLVTNKYGPDGYINTLGVADSVYLKNAFQRISYSLHNQGGILASYQKDINKNLRMTGGAEFRMWSADHPGYFTNLFGKSNITQRYAFRDTTGKVSTSTFSRKAYQGDINGPTSDIGNIFGWNMDNDPSYQTQYRNYLGQTPQLTLFAQGNWSYKKLNIMGSLQYVWYQYKLTENMPSENAIGQQLKPGEVSALGLVNEGSVGTKFYMKDNSATPKWYAFDLINADRSRGFFQPKVGFNVNATENVNVFANFAHVERFVDLGVYYNQGRLNPDAQDEKSNQFELGIGWSSENLFAKLNGYYMLWDNKSANIQDITKAGEPGYDRNGFRSELIGTSQNMGAEFELTYSLDKLFNNKITGFGLRGSLTYMNNTWKTVLDQVKKNPDGADRVFNATAIDENGNTKPLLFKDLEGTRVASGPQFMSSLSLTYDRRGFFGSIDMSHFANDYLLDGGTYTQIDGSYIGTTPGGKELFRSTYDNVLPYRILFDFNAGYNFNFGKQLPLKGTITFQVLNIFDTDFLSSADRFGVIPGVKRSYRANISLGW